MKPGGRGGRGIRAGGSGDGEMNREVAISKALSKLLRHAAVDVGLKLDLEGFARVDQVVGSFFHHWSSEKRRQGSSEVDVTCLSSVPIRCWLVTLTLHRCNGNV